MLEDAAGNGDRPRGLSVGVATRQSLATCVHAECRLSQTSTATVDASTPCSPDLDALPGVTLSGSGPDRALREMH